MMLRCSKNHIADFTFGGPFTIKDLEAFSVRNNALVIIDDFGYIEDGIFVTGDYHGNSKTD